MGYVLQGYGHSIENVDGVAGHIRIGFNARIYEAIDRSQWIGANPKDVLAANFGQPVEVLGKFPVAMCSSPARMEPDRVAH